MPLPQVEALSRLKDLEYLTQCIENNHCCAIIGLSNMGKSSLLRQIQHPGTVAQFSNLSDEQISFVYIDFNLQLQMTGQGFYELVLRTVLNNLKSLDMPAELLQEVETAYQDVVAPASEFQHALSFNQAIISLCEQWSRRLVLLFDEFDEIFSGIDTRVFLNLRALRDRYPERLLYIAVVGKPLQEQSTDTASAEFAELFAHHTHYLHPLEMAEVRTYIKNFAETAQISLSKDDVRFIMEQSGGHPGLLDAVCQVIAADTVAGVQRDQRLLRDHLSTNANIRSEAIKLWQGLGPPRQQALIALFQNEDLDPAAKKALKRKGILQVDDSGQPHIFSKLFEDFVRRQYRLHHAPEKGVILDIDSGEVYVDGQKTELLTSLEYRLLLLLYGQMDKICDKYQIVESVWGEDYIDEVDDARIEKLISRLRHKIEPTPSEPQYLVTVRGRGYRLQSTAG